VVVVMPVLAVLGLNSLRRVPADLLPIFKTPAVQIVTLYPGIPPVVVEEHISSQLQRWTGQSVGIARQEAKNMLGTDADHSRAANSWLFPELRLGTNLGAFGPTFGNLNDQEQYYTGVQWELAFGDIAGTQIADARRREAPVRLQDTRNQVRADLVTAVATLTSAKAQLAAAEREVEAAQAALQLVEGRYRGGDTLLLEVLDAERTAIAASINLINAIAQNRAQFDLLILVGGPRDQREDG